MLIFFSIFTKIKKIGELFTEFFLVLWGQTRIDNCKANPGNEVLMKKENVKFRPRHFTEADRAVLDSYRPVVEALGVLFGPCCQVVLGSLEEPHPSFVALSNAVISHRHVGGPVMPEGLSFLEENAWLGSTREEGEPVCRETFSSDGRRLKNINVGIFNGNKLIGYLGINMDMDVPLADFLEALRLKTEHEDRDVPRHFDGDSADYLTRVLESAMAEEKERGGGAKQRVKRIVARLEELGAFNMRGAVDFVAQRLGVSRNTVYLHLRSLRETDRADE